MKDEIVINRACPKDCPGNIKTEPTVFKSALNTLLAALKKYDRHHAIILFADGGGGLASWNKFKVDEYTEEFTNVEELIKKLNG